MLVTGVDQTSHSTFLHFALISFVFLHSVDNLLYDFIFSVPNIVDPKSLTLLGVSSSQFQFITGSYGSNDGNSDQSVFMLVDSAIKVCLAASRLGWVSFPDSSIIHVCCT